MNAVSLESFRGRDLSGILGRRYLPTYLNLASLFREEYPLERLHQLAMRLAYLSERYNDEVDRYFLQPISAPFDLRVDGFSEPIEREMRNSRTGLIAVSFRLGCYTRIPLELAALGWRVLLAGNAAAVEQRTRSLEKLEARTAALDEGSERDLLLRLYHGLAVLDITKRRAAVSLLQGLRSQNIAVMYADGNNGIDGPWGDASRVEVQFFNKRVFVKNGAARLALASGAPLLITAAIRMPDGKAKAIFGDILRPPTTRSSSSDESFTATAMRCIYSTLERWAKAHLDQWLGVSVLHRWYRGLGSDVASGGPSDGSLREVLASGGRVAINAAAGISPVPGHETEVWVNLDTMHCYRAPAWAADVIGALTTTGGIGDDWLMQHCASPDLRLKTEALLADLYVRNLLSPVLGR